jgi:hypothetical protein
MFFYIGYVTGCFLVLYLFYFILFLNTWGLTPNEVPLYWSWYLLCFFITQGGHKHRTFHYSGYDIFSFKKNLSKQLGLWSVQVSIAVSW